jgi:hypothetical protein
VGTVTLSAPTSCQGITVTSASLGWPDSEDSTFAEGMLVAHDPDAMREPNRSDNLKLFRWGDVARAFVPELRIVAGETTGPQVSPEVSPQVSPEVSPQVSPEVSPQVNVKPSPSPKPSNAAARLEMVGWGVVAGMMTLVMTLV